MTRTATTFLFAGMRWKTRFIPFRVGQPFRIGRTVSLWVLSASAFDRSTTYVQGHYFPLPAALQDSRMLRATSRRSIGDATETSIADSSGLRLAGLRIHPSAILIAAQEILGQSLNAIPALNYILKFRTYGT